LTENACVWIQFEAIEANHPPLELLLLHSRCPARQVKCSIPLSTLTTDFSIT
jgi:hypothetical protein